MVLEESTFILYAAKYYDNPHCQDVAEFEEDLKRFQYIRKLFSRYNMCGDLKERLILNHLTIIYNCFGANATELLFMKLYDYQEFLKPFVSYLNFLPNTVEFNNKIIDTSKIESDMLIVKRLKEI